ncbi:MAG: HIT domain-containing protein [Synergistaceae bacterium]|jgi:ATP adenylyltransferase|nr:HIT domain-containing protein [Synergistaceae bacterium]
MSYIGAPKHEGCIFCDFPAEERDEERYILHRGVTCFVILNLYPYNPGHLMIVPFRHTNLYESLTDDEHAEMSRLAARSVAMLKRVPGAEAFNMGMNLGKGAGAGVDGHLHLHVVPRWNGDNNFMPVLADTRVVPEAMAETYRNLKAAWEA